MFRRFRTTLTVLVAAILAIAQPALTKMFNDAIALVHQ